ncbi:hypothetical protein RND81_12G214600 [Saponaria officinalis]
MCRRPETDYRLQLLHTANEAAAAAPSTSVSAESSIPVVDLTNTTSRSPTAFVAPYVQPRAQTLSPIKPPTLSSTSVLSPGAPASASVPVTVSARISAPVNLVVTETSALVPEQKNVKDDKLNQILVPVTESNKIAIDNSALVPEPSKIENAPVPVLLPEPSKIETDSSAPISVPGPIKAENDVPLSVPEPNHAESVNLRISDGEAGVHANIKNPTEAKNITEAKIAETSDLKTDALAESSALQSQTKSDLSIEILGQEKVGISSVLVGAETVSRVAGSAESTVISEEAKG